jgi:hypothetical protein
MANLKVIHDKIYKSTAYLAVGFYPIANAVYHFSYGDKGKINKDCFMVGMWKIKQLKK